MAKSKTEHKALSIRWATAALTILTFLPFVIVIPFQLNMILQASLTVYIGCNMSVIDPSKGKKTEERETLSKKDVMKFPLIGSCALLGLYIALKISKELVNTLLTIYFNAIGVAAFASLFGPVINPFMPVSVQKKKEIPLKVPYLLEATLSGSEVICGVLGVIVATANFLFKHWLCNNIFGIAFSLKGIELLSIGSNFNGIVLLSGLFFYDIFWVFGTDVMVTVAKNFDAPIKLLFPRDFSAPPEKRFSMLGLGDIVIPALFIAILLRWDIQRQQQKRVRKGEYPYFIPVWICYCIGLLTTVFVMMTYNAAQPALLYLVPACLGSSVFVALSRKEFKEFFNHAEHEDHEGRDQPWFQWPWQSSEPKKIKVEDDEFAVPTSKKNISKKQKQ